MSQATPYPTLGECVRFLAISLDTKSGDRDVDRLAQDGDFNWSLLDDVIQRLLVGGVGGILQGASRKAYTSWLVHVRAVYQRVLMGTPLDSVSRADVADILIDQLWVPLAANLLTELANACPGPLLPQLLDPSRPSVDVVFAWADEQISVDVVKSAYPERLGPDKTERDKISKWRAGDDIPSAQGLKLLAKRLDAHPDLHAVSSGLSAWLLVAAAISRIERSVRLPIRKALQGRLADSEVDLELLNQRLQFAVRTQGRIWMEMARLGTPLWEDLRRRTGKHLGDQATTLTRLHQLTIVAAEMDSECRTAYHLAWMKARWHVLSGEYEDSLPHYQEAVNLATYRAGHQIRDLIEEALCLAAFVGSKKPFLKQLKHLAVSIGLLQRPQSEDVLEDWEVEQFANRLFEVFPPQGRFPECAQDLSHAPISGLMLISPEKIAAMAIDRRKPDRVRAVKFGDGTVRRWPQLRLFASFGLHEKVRELLDLGASVDLLDSHGGSALLCAIQHATDRSDRRALDLLLQAPHLSKTLNVRTTRKRLSPLMCAIELGQPDVVQALLEQGADPNLDATTDSQSPLYCAVSRAWCTRNPVQLMARLFNGVAEQPNGQLKETLRRYGVVTAGVFGDKTQAWKQDPPLAMETIKAMVNVMTARHSMQRLLSISQMLLEYGANPNKPHRYPLPGYTPLMLAVESNLPEFVHAMLVHGGDPLRPDGSGRNCFEIAQGFKSQLALNAIRAYR